jgi:HK97 family phage major capsid protein
MTTLSAIELRSLENKLLDDAFAIQQLAEKEGRVNTEEELARIDKHCADATESRSKADTQERKEKLNALRKQTEAPTPRKFEAPAFVEHRSGSKKIFTEVDYKKGLFGWVLGKQRASSEQQFLVDEVGLDMSKQALYLDTFQKQIEERSIATTGTGINLTPINMNKTIEETTKYFFDAKSSMEQFSTEDMSAYNWPLWDSTQIVAGTTAELAAPNNDFGSGLTDPTIANASSNGRLNGSFGAVRYDSGIYALSEQQIASSVINLVDQMFKSMMTMVARKEEVDGILGAGGNNTTPQGFVTSSTTTLTLGSSNNLSEDILIQLLHTLDISRRNLPTTGYLMADDTWGRLERVTDNVGRKIFSNFLDPSAAIGQRPKIGKYPVYISNQMPVIGNGSSKPIIIFGDLSVMKWRNISGKNGVGGPTLFRYEEILRSGLVPSNSPIGGALGVQFWRWGFANQAYENTNVPALVALNCYN